MDELEEQVNLSQKWYNLCQNRNKKKGKGADDDDEDSAADEKNRF